MPDSEDKDPKKEVHPKDEVDIDSAADEAYQRYLRNKKVLEDRPGDVLDQEDEDDPEQLRTTQKTRQLDESEEDEVDEKEFADEDEPEPKHTFRTTEKNSAELEDQNIKKSENTDTQSHSESFRNSSEHSLEDLAEEELPEISKHDLPSYQPISSKAFASNLKAAMHQEPPRGSITGYPLEEEANIPHLKSSQFSRHHQIEEDEQNHFRPRASVDGWPPQHEDSRNEQAFSYKSRRKNKKNSMLVLVLIGLVVIVGTVVLLKGRNIKSLFNTPAPSVVIPVTTPTPTPTPTPVPLDRSKFKIRVLNGTTKTGLAATVLAKLKDLGYQTDKSANATNSAFVSTMVRVKDNNSDLITQLIKDLSPDYDATSSTPLKAGDPADAEVILGLK